VGTYNVGLVNQVLLKFSVLGRLSNDRLADVDLPSKTSGVPRQLGRRGLLDSINDDSLDVGSKVVLEQVVVVLRSTVSTRETTQRCEVRV
jgi:hypothetical protein